MTIDYRLANPNDAVPLAEVRHATWPDEATDLATVENTLLSEHHATIVATSDDRVVGYLCCFLTTRHSNITYWEHDQLAVHPDFRRQGLARELIARAYEIGFVRGNDQHRAWIHATNIPSQGAFQANGFQTDMNPYRLYICQQPQLGTYRLSAHADLIPVQTLSYQGYWLEGDVHPDDFWAARTYLAHPHTHLVGMMIPANRGDLVIAAQAAAFAEIATFHRWWRA